MFGSFFAEFVCFAFTLVLLSFSLDYSAARPVGERVQDNMTTLLEEDYENVAQLWEIFNSYYETYDYQADPVECL